MEDCLHAAVEVITALGCKYYQFVNSGVLPPVNVTPFNPADFCDNKTLKSIISSGGRVLLQTGIKSLEELFEQSQQNPEIAGRVHRACLEEQTKDLIQANDFLWN